MNPSTVQYISECFVPPQYVSEEIKQACYLTPWDLAMIPVQCIQKGLLFKNQQNYHKKTSSALSWIRLNTPYLSHTFISTLLLAALSHKRLPSYVIFVNNNNNPGAKLIHASLDMTISDILSPNYVPLVVHSCFDNDRALNNDGHTRSLLSIQVTDLVDGIFIGCSMSHTLGDETSFSNFFNSWSEIFEAQVKAVSVCPLITLILRWS